MRLWSRDKSFNSAKLQSHQLSSVHSVVKENLTNWKSPLEWVDEARTKICHPGRVYISRCRVLSGIKHIQQAIATSEQPHISLHTSMKHLTLAHHLLKRRFFPANYRPFNNLPLLVKIKICFKSMHLSIIFINLLHAPINMQGLRYSKLK